MPGPTSLRLQRFRSADTHEVDDEHERGAGLDDAARAALAVGLVRGDGEPAPSADLHPDDPLVPALDDHAHADAELQRVAAVPGGVELLAALVGDADVVGAHQVAGLGLLALADDEVLDHQVVGGGAGRRLDVGAGGLGHQYSSGSGAGWVPTGSPIQTAVPWSRRAGLCQERSAAAGDVEHAAGAVGGALAQ